MKYPYIWAYGRMRKAPESEIKKIEEAAEADNAPRNAVWWGPRQHKWVPFNEIRNKLFKERLQKLRDELPGGDN